MSFSERAGFAVILGILFFTLAQAGEQCCPDDYKAKSMPKTAPGFSPCGNDCYKIKVQPKTYPYFHPCDQDNYQKKTMPRVGPHSTGLCGSDGGTGPGFWGLRQNVKKYGVYPLK